MAQPVVAPFCNNSGPPVAHMPVEKWNELPATLAFLMWSRTGIIGTPIDSAQLCVTGNPKHASRSRDVSHDWDRTCHILPLFRRKVGIFLEVALQQSLFEGVSPKKITKSSSEVAAEPMRFLYKFMAYLTPPASRRFSNVLIEKRLPFHVCRTWWWPGHLNWKVVFWLFKNRSQSFLGNHSHTLGEIANKTFS